MMLIYAKTTLKVIFIQNNVIENKCSIYFSKNIANYWSQIAKIEGHSFLIE